MKLFIDTSKTERITIGLDDQRFTTQAKKEKAQKLLSLIDQTLKEKKKTLKDIKEIEINTGPGSFTGLRVGISVANALGYSLNIPVNGRNTKKEGPIEPKY